ncbi:MAG: MerR family transcriptional regulator [Bacteroidia bacterium]|nr:MerR family transcriptional regulator [Bacteroidia bacterium]
MEINTEDSIEKKYFSIGEAAQKLNISVSMLRFYEKKFPDLKPRKTKGGTRKYSNDDIHLIQRIIHLTKTEGYTLEGAKEKLTVINDNPAEEIKIKLNTLKNFLIELKHNLS